MIAPQSLGKQLTPYGVQINKGGQKMALVKFLQGPVDNLPQEISNGSIYFTTDEGKLYIDTEDGERIEINAKGAEGLIRDGEFVETEEVYKYIDGGLEKKQDILNGTKGQVVGFNEEGKAIAQDVSVIGDMEKSVYDTEGKSQDIFKYVDNAIGNVKIEMDEVPTERSENAVKSGGVYQALEDAGNNWLPKSGGTMDGNISFPFSAGLKLLGAGNTTTYNGNTISVQGGLGISISTDRDEQNNYASINGLYTPDIASDRGGGNYATNKKYVDDGDATKLDIENPTFTGTMTGPSIEIIPPSKTKVLQKPIALSLANDGTTMSITDNYNGIFIDTTSNIVWVGSSSTAIGIDNGRLVFRFDGENSQASLILMDMGSGITISGIVMPPGNNIYAAANKKYVDDTVKQSVTSYLTTLYANNWSNNTQSIEAPNVIGDELTQEVRICPATIDIDTYIDFGIRAINVTSGAIRFKCDSVPTSDIDIFINTQIVTPTET